MRCFIVVMSLAGWNVYADAGDADTGRQLSQTCAACHGADGNSVNPIWPKLSGQHAAYTVKQLQDFKAGNRKNSQMTAMVVNLSEESMSDLAAYYADQKISIGTTRPELLATGETIYRAGDIAAGLPACMGCHNPTGAGNPAALYPSLSGQHAAYTVSQLKSFKLEQRHNDKNAVMRLIAGRMSNAQMEAVAEYIQGVALIDMAKIKTAWVLFGLLFACTAAAQGYQDIDPPQPTRSGDNIEMIEVFLYTCPHCYDFEPYLEKWLENKPQDVEFRRIPGVFRKDSIPHAKAFYTAEKLNVLDKVHQPLFDAIHLRKQKIHGERALKKFFTRHGVDGGEFTRVYNSAEVDDMVKQAFLLAQHYKVAGVPSIIINGKYLVSGNLAGSLANMLEVAAELIEKERRLLQQP